MLGTHLIFTSLFESQMGRERLAQTIQEVLPFASPYIVVGTPFLFNHTEGATSVTPAWRTSLWHVSPNHTASKQRLDFLIVECQRTV